MDHEIPSPQARAMSISNAPRSSLDTTSDDPSDINNQYYLQLQNLREEKVPSADWLTQVDYDERKLIQEGPDGDATWFAKFRLVRTEVGRDLIGPLPRDFTASGRSKVEAKNAAAKRLLEAIDYRWPGRR
ncbi:hypothetical protein FRB99_004708 [Tulasnella sp. 403]|nr:hypothetical protein FRB99_004708 [Tulasnella sp. 403]